MKEKDNKIDNTEDLIKEIANEIVGKIGSKLVEILYKKKNTNEFLIAKKLGLTINQTRNLLYKLTDKGLVHFIRKKDSKKGGWYIYFWTLNEKRSLQLLKEQKIIKINEMNSRLQKRKNDRHYYCPASGLEYNEEEALENNFICPETGEVLQLKDSKEEVDKLDIEISKLKIIVEELEINLSTMETKEKKVKEKRIIKEEKIKKAEKDARRKKLKKEREKLKKKNPLEKVEKKSLKKSKKKQ